MAKWSGQIAFGTTEETSPGIWESVIDKVLNCRGDVIKDALKYHNGSKVLGDISVSNKISIVANPFIRSNHQRIQYVTFYGSRWKVSNIEFEYPRMILTIGDVYPNDE